MNPLQIKVVDANQHRLDEYADVFQGYKALELIDENGKMRGELVWRLATGDTVEITEMGIFDPADRRQGWGSQLLEAGIASMQEFFVETGRGFRRVYLFCDSVNDAGRAFYEARAFRVQAVLKDFYHYCDAVLYERNIQDENVA